MWRPITRQRVGPWRRWVSSAPEKEKLRLSEGQRRVLEAHKQPKPFQTVVVTGGPATGKSICAASIVMETETPILVLAPSALSAPTSMLQYVHDQMPLGFLDAAEHVQVQSMGEWCRKFTDEFSSTADQRILNRAEVGAFLYRHIDSIPWRSLQKGYKSSRMLQNSMRDLLQLFQHLEMQGISPEAYAEYVAQLKHDTTSMSAEVFADFVDNHMELSTAYKAYRELLLSQHVNTWHGSILDALDLLERHPFYLHSAMQAFDSVLVDDFHDLTPAMIKVLSHIVTASRTKNCLAFSRSNSNVALFQQSLFEAEPSMNPITTINFANCLYSQPSVVEAAHCIAENTSEDVAPSVECHQFASAADEVSFLADQLSSKEEDNTVLVVCGDASAVPLVMASLRSKGVSAQSLEKTRWFDNTVVQTAHSLLLALANPSESKHIFALLQTSKWRAGNSLIYMTLQLSCSYVDLFEVLRQLVSEDASLPVQVDETTMATLRSFVDLFEQMREMAMEKTCLELLLYYFTTTGELPNLLDPSSDLDAHESQALAAYIDVVASIQGAAGDAHVPFVAPYLRQLRDSGRLYSPPPEPETGHVHVISLKSAVNRPHFVETIYFVAMNNKVFPGRKPRQQNLQVLPIALFSDSNSTSTTKQSYLEECRQNLTKLILQAKSRVVFSSSADPPSRLLAPLWKAPTLHSTKPEILSEPREKSSLGSDVETRSLEYLSFSQIDEYMRCPYRYFLSRVVKMEPKMSPGLVFGRSIHEGIAAWSQSSDLQSPQAYENALEAFSSSWQTGCFRSSEEEKRLFEQGQQTLSSFISFESSQNRVIEAVEMPFQVDIPEAGVRLKGVWDRIERRGEELYIVEFKSNLSNAQRNNQTLAESNLQLQLYMMAFARLHGISPTGAILRSLETTHGLNEEGIVLHSPSADETAIKAIVDAAQSIRQQKFDPLPTFMGCSFCPFADICHAKL
ncbi:hypothetical protein AeMF1_005516 [Aphanomyces euteiches]|nr:hypothetical protein AeMF1_005516 [Aphanomyces euteiches]KAH9182380.1 hypothetical protein AeNC1_015646 [Aphanomyces euteiches]